MKKNGFLLIMFLITGCVVIPKETVTLSLTLGSDLEILQKAHRNMVNIHYSKIRNEINSFVNDVYSPFVINYVLKSELKNYKLGNKSLFGTIEIAGQKGGKEETDNALQEMSDFLNSARKQIEGKREELITPISLQENQILLAIDQSYENATYANSTITAYLQSIRKVKSAQEEALSKIGLNGADTLITSTLVKLSEKVEVALNKGKEIDTKSDDAYEQLEGIIKELKEITNKK
jgi:hypothetical protein